MKLYSKAVKVLKELPQEKFDVNQLVATLKNKGVKPAEIENAKLPATGTYPKQALMDVFETFKPRIGVTKYGTLNTNELSNSQFNEYQRLLGMRTADMTDEDVNRQEDLERKMRLTPTQYHGYKLPGGHDYQEHLIQLGGERQYTSSHWQPGNILAHVRLSNRIMPDGRKMLHIEEVQSDWGQQGREKGFGDPENPFEVFETKTGKTVSAHPTHSAARNAFQQMPDEQSAGLDYGSTNKPPAAPYVTNTQGWTDLALKHILSHAAAGNYDGVIFTPGQAQVDRYKLEKSVDEIYYHPETGQFEAAKDGNLRYRKTHKPEELPGVIGKELSEKLLSTPRVPDGDHVIKGDDLKVGGKGMKTYYDKMLPKSVIDLAQQHDKSVKGSYEPINNQYSGFSIPMTQKLKDSINQNGFPAFKRGGYAHG